VTMWLCDCVTMWLCESQLHMITNGVDLSSIPLRLVTDVSDFTHNIMIINIYNLNHELIQQNVNTININAFIDAAPFIVS